MTFDPGGRAFENCPLGDAVVTTNGLGHVIVQFVNTNGNDGVEVDLATLPCDIEIGELDLAPPNINTNALQAFIDFYAVGVVDGTPDEDIASILFTRENVNTNGFESTVTVDTEFTASGTAYYNVRITSNGVEVTSQANLSGSVRIRATSGGSRDESPPVIAKLRVAVGASASASAQRRARASVDAALTFVCESEIEIFLPGVSPPVFKGDTMIFSAGDGSVDIQTISTINLRAAHIHQAITITNEEGPCVSIPAVSTWGLIFMTLLLLTVGSIVFGRRRRMSAAA